ncbi:MAG: penicillin-binding protein 1C [Rhodocyclaceae bacterium]
MMRAWVLAAGLLSALPAMANTLPDFEAVRSQYAPSDWLLLDRQGQPLQRLRIDRGVRRLAWQRLGDTSPALQRALVTAEDQRFWQHGGVNWLAFARAAFDKAGSALGGDKATRGASTISMQLAALLDEQLRAAPGQRRDISRKWDQAMAARELESHWSKPQIFEAWLNLVPWRGETVGIAAASEVWFGKQPDGLDYGEAALLAALVRQPQAPAARVAERACAILATLRSEDASLPLPPCESLKGLAVQKLPRRSFAPPLQPAAAPHAARLALADWTRQHGNTAPPALAAGTEPALHSTLDGRLQRLANASLRRHLRELRRQNVEDGALIVIDNASGEVLAWVGSSGTLSDAAEVDGVLALRQAGSTLKPFLYALAIEQQRLTAASLIDDSPLALTAENGVFIPRNYDRQFRGWVSARTALASSLNIPAVRTLLLTGITPFYERLKRLGFSTLTESADHYGLSLALGGSDVRLLDLANAYRTLANRGMAQNVRRSRDEAAGSKRRVLSEEASFIVGDILSDRGARAPGFGLENALATPFWTAVKTGTSKDMRDNWCAGFSDRYTVAVWVGNASGAPMWDVSGVQGAAPVWREMMMALHADSPSRPPSPPRALQSASVRFSDIEESPRREWFIAGTEVREVGRVASDEATPRIRYPANGLIVALDPDIPAANERLPFDMAPLRSDHRWQLERSGSQPCRLELAASDSWAPEPGEWALSLQDSGGKTLEQVRFAVRGSPRHATQCPENRN